MHEFLKSQVMAIELDCRIDIMHDVAHIHSRHRRPLRVGALTPAARRYSRLADNKTNVTAGEDDGCLGGRAMVQARVSRRL